MKPIAVLTTIPSDSHNWNLLFISLFLEEQGFSVINLGPSVPYDVVLDTCNQYHPDLLVVSTINGHGYIEGRELIMRVRDMDIMKDKPVFIGGKLSTDENMSSLYVLELEEGGYTKAYTGNVNMQDFTTRLQSIAAQSAISRQA
ncbi:cobalamin-dependent protein [Chitinophaga sp.]|uniref:cobalamin B12-binding domain-containing protein n=1 Tax=Chitinophaga sp. TaxID=1869181 RepID=UPI0031D1F222